MKRPPASSTPNSALERRLVILQDEINKILKKIGTEEASTLPARMSLWQVVREYLRTVGGSDTPQNIANALVAAGHDLGKYPLRNVKIMVTSRYTKNIFNLVKDSKSGNEKIVLTGQTVEYKPQVYR